MLDKNNKFNLYLGEAIYLGWVLNNNKACIEKEEAHLVWSHMMARFISKKTKTQLLRHSESAKGVIVGGDRRSEAVGGSRPPSYGEEGHTRLASLPPRFLLLGPTSSFPSPSHILHPLSSLLPSTRSFFFCLFISTPLFIR